MLMGDVGSVVDVLFVLAADLRSTLHGYSSNCSKINHKEPLSSMVQFPPIPKYDTNNRNGPLFVTLEFNWSDPYPRLTCAPMLVFF